MKRLAFAMFFIVKVLTSFDVYAQDFQKKLEDLKNKYAAAENLRLILLIDAYQSKGSQKPFYHEKAIIEKHGVEYRYQLSQSDMIMNEKYIVVVDHSVRQIVINERDPKGETRFYNKTQINMDSVLQFFEDGKFEGIEGGSSKYTVKQKTGEIQQIELFIDQQSGNIDKINYLYKTGSWVIILFNEFELTPTFDGKEFNEQQFVRRTGKNWQPIASLNGYKVVMSNR